jgi:Mg2+ and Co2+ transporter CorA
VLSLRQVFAGEEATLAELGDELEAHLTDLEGVDADAEHLQTVRKSLQDEAMNGVLFVLTSATVFSLPCSLLVGYFGMNFSDMSELDPGGGLFGVGGVKLFWIALVVALALVLALFLHLRLFRFAWL